MPHGRQVKKAGDCFAGENSPLPVMLGVPRPCEGHRVACFANMLDVFCIFNGFNAGFPYAPCPCGDISPCAGDNFVNMLDVFCAFNAFNEGFPYTQCPCADIAPCGGDSFVNMQDVFAIFSAFNDNPACPDPCP